MNSLFLFVFFAVSSVSASAQTSSTGGWDVPSPGSLTQKSISKSATVRMKSFSLQVARGWSVQATALAGPDKNTTDRSDAMLTATPTEDIQHSLVYVGVRTEYPGHLESLDARYKRMSRQKKNGKVKFVKWNGERWLLWEYERPGIQGSPPSENWSAFGLKNKTQFLMLAGAPKAQAAKYAGALLKMMATIRLSK